MSKCFKNRNLDTFCFHIPSELLKEFRSLCHLNGDVQRQMVMNMMKDYIRNKNHIDTNTSKMEKTSRMSEELMIAKEDLVNWLDRPPSNDDLDLIGFITTRLENFYKLEQENKQLKREKNIMQNYLQLIIDIGYDYDGYNDVKNLKELIDELCKYALYGKNLDDKKIVASSCENYYNILGEEILGDKENE